METIDSAILFMKNKVINLDSDKTDIIEAMMATSQYRKNWISSEKPTITDILENFPKFMDMPYLVIHFC